MVAPRRRNAATSERAKSAKRYLIVILVCLVAVYMLADVEELAESDNQNRLERTEMKPSHNQLRGMPEKNNYEEQSGNRNFDPNVPIPGEDINQMNSNYNTNNNADNSGENSMMNEKYDQFPNKGVDSENQMNGFRSGDESRTEGQAGKKRDDDEFKESEKMTSGDQQTTVQEGDEDEDDTESTNEADDEEAESNEDIEDNGNKNTGETEEALNNNEQPNEGTNSEGQEPSQNTEEEEMVKQANNNEANEELSTTISDLKMEIEEVEEEEVVKEMDKVLKNTLQKEEDNMKNVIEHILKDKKYGMSNDALKDMEKEVEERLETEINDELNEKAEQIAKEKQEEIDVVVIEDRNMYPNPADIEKDVKKMEKYFVMDMEREIGDTANVIKGTIPKRLENITMEVMEERTGLHIEEDVLKSTEKAVADEKSEQEKAVEGSKSTSDSHAEKESKPSRTTEKKKTSATKPKKVKKTTDTKKSGTSHVSDVDSGSGMKDSVEKVQSIPKAVREEKVIDGEANEED